MGIYSAYIIGEPKCIYIHHTDIIENNNFETLKLMKNIRFIKLNSKSEDIISIKLDILYEWGGIIMETNILVYNDFNHLIADDKDLIFFRDFEKNMDITNNLSKYIIYAKKKTEYLKKYKAVYEKSKEFILSEDWHTFDNIGLVQNEFNLIYSDSNELTNSSILFYYDEVNYTKIQESINYKTIMKNLKHKMIVKTPKNDSLFYAITDLLINSNRIKNNLETDNFNIDILSIKYSKVYTNAKNELKKKISDIILFDIEKEYNVDRIIELVNSIYGINLRIIKLHDYGEKLKIYQLKNIIINVVDKYYITIK